MLKNYIAVIIILLVAACGNKKNDQRNNNKINLPPVKDSIFISEVYTFDSANQIYIQARKKLGHSQIVNIQKKLDSTIYEDRGKMAARKRIAPDIAEKYFGPYYPDTVTLYNNQNKPLVSLRKKRIEYYTSNSYNGFIVLYNPIGAFERGDESYVSGFNDGGFPEVTIDSINNKKLSKKLKYNFNLDVTKLLNERHIQFNQSTYSIIAYASQKDSTINSCLFKTENGSSSLLKRWQHEKGYILWDILPVPATVNDYPLILTTVALPGKSYRDIATLVYNGKEYKFQHTSLIKTKEYLP